MAKTVARQSTILLMLAVSLPLAAATDGTMKILTFSVGLAVGEHLIEVDLGPSGKPAELHLDGELVCSPDSANPRCPVDLGEAPRVYLLELIRRNAAGDEEARAERWINRPGQEAELAMRLADRTNDSVCGGRVIWLHPLKQHPVMLELTHNGRRLRIAEDGRSFAFPCFDAEKIWFVTPDTELRRMNAFGSNTYKGFNSSSGRANWLTNLFEVGMRPHKGDTRLADAVAASGLVAAAGPRRRAIVLILGNRADRDDSLFSAEQAQAYLGEIAVPLLVIRTGKVRDDGWPTGIKVHNMQSLATTLEALKERLDRQCIVWFHSEQHLSRIAEALPQGVTIAGRRIQF